MAAVDRLGAEVLDAVEGDEVAAVEEGEPLQQLAALGLAEDVPEQGPQVPGADAVEDLAHLRVAGDVVQAEDGAEVGVAGAALEGEQGGVALAGRENMARPAIRASARPNRGRRRPSGTFEKRWRARRIRASKARRLRCQRWAVSLLMVHLPSFPQHPPGSESLRKRSPRNHDSQPAQPWPGIAA